MNAEELELLGDSKYRNYVAAVDKALKSFEYSSEWADLISSLGKLNKVWEDLGGLGEMHAKIWGGNWNN